MPQSVAEHMGYVLYSALVFVCTRSADLACISRSAVKVGDVDSSECSDIDIDECLSLSYHPREGVPGFVVA